MTHGFGGFLLLLEAGWGCSCWAGWRAGGGPGFIFFLENQNIELNKKQKLFGMSLCCVAGIFDVTDDVSCQPEGVYIVLVSSQLWITTPGINQSSQGESGKCSSLFSL